MGFSEDINNSIKDWKKSSLIWKIITVIAVFFAISSITSLSEVVIGWKGFLLDGVEFYRSVIKRPVNNFFGSIGLNFTSFFLDQLFLVLFLFTIMLRARIQMYKAGEEDFTSIMSILLFQAINLFLIMYGANNSKSFFIDWISMSMFILLFIMNSAQIIGISAIKGSYKYVIATFSAPLLALFIILMLAAINKGLLS